MKNEDDINLKLPVEIEQYERKIYDLNQLIEISKGLNSTLDYNTLIDSILLTCMGQMQLLKAGIFLRIGISNDSFFLHRNYKGFELNHAIEYELIPDSNLIKFLEKEAECFTLEELRAHVDPDSSLQIMNILNPSLIVPLVSKGILNGVIILGERINFKDFLESEKEYMLNIASLAAIAIHNAVLYEMATTDMMTKLKIHHYFQTILSEEIERSKKLNRPLCLLMADIDHFKEFNDTYGHQAGDYVLIAVSRLIRECVRLSDIAARYGGEEFSIILPGTEIHESLIVAERLRSVVESEEILYKDKKLQVTISIGLTQFDPGIDFYKKDFIERTDRALYLSKKNGRNLVTLL